MTGNKLNILICPLGWGLGHASRDIPIIEYLLKQGHQVIVAGDDIQLHLIKQRFQDIKTEPFPSLKIRFRRGNSQLLPIIWYALRLPFFNLWEHQKLKRIIADNTIDVVISDNRYGLWNKRIKTIIITHQLRLIPPFPFRWTASLTELIIKKWLMRFNHVWVPDFAGINSIAGDLSKSNGLETLHYVGPLSRFINTRINAVFSSFEMVVVASGPEPQRSIFVQKSSAAAKRLRLNCLIIEGKPSEGVVPRNNDGVWHVGHLPDLEFALAVKNAKYMIVRGGYSTIMDLLALGVSGAIVPTPGQTEQEYLAVELSKKGLFNAVNQNELDSIDVELMLNRRIEPLEVGANFVDALDSL